MYEWQENINSLMQENRLAKINNEELERIHRLKH